MKCYRHPESEAVGTDAVVDLSRGGPHEVFYKRVPICSRCVIVFRDVNTSRIEMFSESNVRQPIDTAV